MIPSDVQNRLLPIAILVSPFAETLVYNELCYERDFSGGYRMRFYNPPLMAYVEKTFDEYMMARVPSDDWIRIAHSTAREVASQLIEASITAPARLVQKQQVQHDIRVRRKQYKRADAESALVNAAEALFDGYTAEDQTRDSWKTDPVLDPRITELFEHVETVRGT